MEHVRVLVVDDHAHAREAICSILSEDSLFEVIGTASNGQEALEAHRAMDARPDPDGRADAGHGWTGGHPSDQAAIPLCYCCYGHSIG